MSVPFTGIFEWIYTWHMFPQLAPLSLPLVQLHPPPYVSCPITQTNQEIRILQTPPWSLTLTGLRFLWLKWPALLENLVFFTIKFIAVTSVNNVIYKFQVPSPHIWYLLSSLPPPPPFPSDNHHSVVYLSVSLFCLFICCLLFYIPPMSEITQFLSFSIWVTSLIYPCCH